MKKKQIVEHVEFACWAIGIEWRVANNKPVNLRGWGVR